MPTPPLPDLVQDSELRVRFRGDTTVHRLTTTDSSGRRLHYEEHWKVERHLGQGSYGMVWKECCVQGYNSGGPPKTRAVKRILKPQKTSKGVYYEQELEAIAKFSNPKVTQSFVDVCGANRMAVRVMLCQIFWVVCIS